ncbi:MAG: ATP-binding protein [Hyphomicrobiales bacterium]
MKLGSRLIVSLAIPLTVLILVLGLLDQAGNRERSRDEVAREGRAIARAVQIAMQFALRDRQPEDVRALIDRIAGYEHVLGLRLFNADGSLAYESGTLRGQPMPDSTSLRDVLARHTSYEARLVERDGPKVTYLVPLVSRAGTLFGAVEVFQLESFVTQEARVRRTSIALLAGSTLLVVVLILMVAVRWNVTRPIETLAQSFREVGAGGPSRRVPIRRHDELGRLTEEFNAMCDRLETARRSLLEAQEEQRRMEARLREAERLAAIGKLAAGLAHEVGTPLNVISGRTEALLRRGVGGEAGARHLEVISGQIDRIARIVRGMLDFGTPRRPVLAPTDLGEVLGNVLELLEGRFEERGIAVGFTAGDPLPAVLADADQLQEVFLNMAVNAVDAMPRGGALSIELGAETRRPDRAAGDGVASDAPRRYVSIAIADTGDGIPAENLGRIFDPFFTTKEVGQGTGLGLSVAYGIVQEHGGWIDVTSEVGRGTRVTVHLPEQGAERTGTPERADAPFEEGAA